MDAVHLCAAVIPGCGEVNAGRHGGRHRSAEDAALHQPLPFPRFINGVYQLELIFTVQGFRHGGGLGRKYTETVGGKSVQSAG